MSKLDSYIDMLESYLELNIDDFLVLNRTAIKNILELLKENKRLKARLNVAQTAYLSLDRKIDKAIKLMNDTFEISSINDMFNYMNKIENILTGSDKDV